MSRIRHMDSIHCDLYENTFLKLADKSMTSVMEGKAGALLVGPQNKGVTILITVTQISNQMGSLDTVAGPGHSPAIIYCVHITSHPTSAIGPQRIKMYNKISSHYVSNIVTGMMFLTIPSRMLS